MERQEILPEEQNQQDLQNKDNQQKEEQQETKKPKKKGGKPLGPKPIKTFLNEYFMKNKINQPEIVYTTLPNHLRPEDKKSKFIQGKLNYQGKQIWARNIYKKNVEHKIYETLIKRDPKIQQKYQELRKQESQNLKIEGKTQEQSNKNISNGNLLPKNIQSTELTISSLLELIDQNFYDEIFLIDRENVQKYEPEPPSYLNLNVLLQLDIVQKRSKRLIKSDYFLSHDLTLKDTSDTILIFIAGILSNKYKQIKITVFTKDHFGDVLQNISKNINWVNPEAHKIVPQYLLQRDIDIREKQILDDKLKLYDYKNKRIQSKKQQETKQDDKEINNNEFIQSDFEDQQDDSGSQFNYSQHSKQDLSDLNSSQGEQEQEDQNQNQNNQKESNSQQEIQQQQNNNKQQKVKKQLKLPKNDNEVVQFQFWEDQYINKQTLQQNQTQYQQEQQNDQQLLEKNNSDSVIGNDLDLDIVSDN